MGSRPYHNTFHPAHWRTAIVVAIKKPKKPNYLAVKAYQLIQLFNCLGKALERVVTRRIMHHLDTVSYGPPNKQFASRAGYSAVDATTNLVLHVEESWRRKMVTSTLTFNISRFFDKLGFGTQLA